MFTTKNPQRTCQPVSRRGFEPKAAANWAVICDNCLPLGMPIGICSHSKRVKLLVWVAFALGLPMQGSPKWDRIVVTVAQVVLEKRRNPR